MEKTNTLQHPIYSKLFIYIYITLAVLEIISRPKISARHEVRNKLKKKIMNVSGLVHICAGERLLIVYAELCTFL